MKTLKENKKEFVISPELKGVVTADYGTFIIIFYHKKNPLYVIFHCLVFKYQKLSKNPRASS